MGLLDDYYRVSDAGILCECCRKPDWCMAAYDGGSVICQRVESPIPIGEAGWLHYLPVVGKPPEKHRVETSTIDWPRRQCNYRGQLDLQRMKQLVDTLGIQSESLAALETGWCGDAWTFPIYNERREIIGIQRRCANGSKRTMRGSCITGVHWPTTFSFGQPIYIVEGHSDCAAALDMGLNVLARLSCSCGRQVLSRICVGHPVTIIADTGNEHERKGALRLQKMLKQVCPQVRIYWPPAKDLRAAVQQYGQETIMKDLC